MIKKALFSKLPKVDEILNEGKIKGLLENYPRKSVVDSIRNQIDKIRTYIINSDKEKLMDYNIDIEQLLNKIVNQVKKDNKMGLRKVVNATGVIIHTNLGRSLISDEIKEELVDIAFNYSNLEFDIQTNGRGSRYSHIEEIICNLTGAEAALVVNNNAAAVLLVLNTIAKNKEVIVSRGQLVEIGGSFRVPDVMAQSGAKLVEVGTTNKTHIYDYENNINEETAAILKIHTSNYKILGFTKEVQIGELVSLSKSYDLPVIEDIGSGTLIDFSKYGITYEPTVVESIKEGADIVTFSGDKLLGGPQAGIIIGKKKYIDEMKKNQLTRAIRVDKMTLVCLEATLRLYLDEDTAINKIPTLTMMTMNIEIIKKRANELYNRIKNCNKYLQTEIIDGYSQIGGGAMPLEKIPTLLIALRSNGISINQLESSLRNYKIPIICRIQDNKVLLDVRTIKDEEFEIIIGCIKEIKGRDVNE